MIQLIIRAAFLQSEQDPSRPAPFVSVIAIIMTWNESESLNSPLMTSIPDLSFKQYSHSNQLMVFPAVILDQPITNLERLRYQS